MKSLLLLIGALTAGLTFWCFTSPAPTEPVSKSVTIIREIKEIGELSLVKIYHGDYLEIDNVGYIYVCEAFIGIDLKKSKIEKINDKEYRIHLPMPELQKDSISLTEDECETVAFKGAKAFFRKHQEWKSEAIKDFREKIDGNNEYIDEAKEQAEDLFKATFKSQGYVVEIKWMESENEKSAGE